MKKLMFIIILFFVSNVLSAQVDSPGDIIWSDPVYTDFFNESCTPQNLVKSATVASRTMVKWFQNDSRWDTNAYGNCSGYTIRSKGCYLTCIAMMLTNTFDYINPKDLEKFMTNNSYLNASCNLYAQTILKTDQLLVAHRPRYMKMDDLTILYLMLIK